MAQAAGGPQTFTVPAASLATATITVRHGETWRFTAEGRWRDLWIPCGPDGYRSFIRDVLDIRPRAEDENWFCLVGMLDDDPSTMFAIGSELLKAFDFRDDSGADRFPDGRLVSVFANDLISRYDNNAGEITLQAEPAAPTPPPSPATAPGSFAAWVADIVTAAAAGWQRWTQVLRETGGILFVATLVLGVSLALLFLQQGRDLILAVGEDGFDVPGAAGRQVWFGLGLLFMAIQGWFWPRMIIESTYGRDRANWKPSWLLTWGPRLLAVAPYALVLVALGRSWETNTGFVVVQLLVGLALLAYLIARNDLEIRRKLRAEKQAPPPAPAETEKPAGKVASYRPLFGREWAIFGVAFAFVAMFIAIFWHVTPERAIGAPAVVFFGVGLLIPGFVVISQLGGDVRLPLLGGLFGLAVVFSFWMDNHAVGRRTAPAETMTTVQPVSLKDEFEAWKKHAPKADGSGHYVMTLVAAEGGASRAGFWAGEVLSALARENPQVDHSLFAISSVSGGSVGAVGYVAAMRETPSATPPQREVRVSGLTGADALSSDMGGLLFTDLAQRFLPIAIPFVPDRAELLEEAWEKGWAETCPKTGCAVDLRKPFTALWNGLPADSWLPLVIVNGANEETGGRILTSKLAVTGSGIDAGSFYELNAGRDVPASSAIHNGARFPWISPAGRLPRGGHILDGGYFDTVGTETVRELARAIRGLPDGDQVDFLLLTIQYQGGKEIPPPGPDKPAVCKPKRGLNELAAPVWGIFASRDGHGAHMLANLQSDVSDPTDITKPNPCLALKRAADAAAKGNGNPAPGAPPTPIPGRSVAVTLKDPPHGVEPLDWALSRKAQNWMRCSAGFPTTGDAPQDDETAKACAHAYNRNLPALGVLTAMLHPSPASAAAPTKP